MIKVDYPIRKKSTKGQPPEESEFFRRCQTCGASFIGLAPGGKNGTGERGIWREWAWYCSEECADG